MKMLLLLILLALVLPLFVPEPLNDDRVWTVWYQGTVMPDSQIGFAYSSETKAEWINGPNPIFKVKR